MPALKNKFSFELNPTLPTIIAGPCIAESYELLDEVASFMLELKNKLSFNYVFKASFDKANRTSFESFRGPDFNKVMSWFSDLKSKYHIPILTDIHETHHVKDVAEVCDVLQIPAFLCRQTDLIAAAIESGRAVNIKKGQFVSPSAALKIIDKAKQFCESFGVEKNFALTERGFSFGYGDLIVDMRGFKVMAEGKTPLIFDITHSVQKPSAGGVKGEISGGERDMEPLLARSVAATGYVDGFFLEVHPQPKKSKSDSETIMSLECAEKILTDILSIWKVGKSSREEVDSLFK